MRAIILILQMTCLGWIPAYSQPCKEEKLSDKKKRMILEEFIVQSGLDGLLTKEKGIVLLNRSTDQEGNEQWYLTPYLQYSLKEAKQLPSHYYNIEGKVVLIWDAANLNQPLDSLQRQQQLQCLEKLISDKVTSPPPPYEEYWDWETVMDSTHQGPVPRPLFDSAGNRVQRKILKRKQTLVTGGPPGAIFSIFGKDGSVQRRFPL